MNIIRKVKISNAWININSKGHSQEFHVHPMCTFSAIYYIKINNDSGALEIMNPAEMFSVPEIGNFRNRDSYQPKEGDLIIFRSNVPHRVLINKSTEDRVSLAMNFVLE